MIQNNKKLTNMSNFSKIIAGTMTWGLWGKKLSTAQMVKLIHECVFQQITSFDHADIYGDYTTETEFGKAFNECGLKRESIQLISKCGIQLISNNRPNQVKHYNYSKEYIIKSAEQSLTNLKIDYLDLFLLHRPSPLMKPQEVLEAILQLKDEGKIRDFGVSNFSVSQMQLLEPYKDIVSNQVECSITQPNALFNGVLDYAMLKHQTPMVWSPLGSYFKQKNEQNFRISKQLDILCKKYQATEDQLFLAWLLKHPSGIHPVVGTANINRLKNAIKSTQINLELEDWFLLLEASQGKETP